MYPKATYVRSPELLRACRELPCQHCGTQDGTVVAAHSNQQAHGKGKGIKADDRMVASLCFRCHHELDQGPYLPKAGRVAMWAQAHARTVSELMRRGLWPSHVAIPE